MGPVQRVETDRHLDTSLEHLEQGQEVTITGNGRMVKRLVRWGIVLSAIHFIAWFVTAVLGWFAVAGLGDGHQGPPTLPDWMLKSGVHLGVVLGHPANLILRLLDRTHLPSLGVVGYFCIMLCNSVACGFALAAVINIRELIRYARSQKGVIKGLA